MHTDPNLVATVNLYSRDLKRSRLFYEALLDLDLNYNLNEKENSFDFFFGGIHFSVLPDLSPERAQQQTSPHFSIYSESLEEIATHLLKMNANIINPLHSSGPFWQLHFSDPDGYIFEIYQQS